MPSQSSLEVYDVQIYDIDLHHLPKIGWNLDADHQFYIVISTDDSAKAKYLTNKEKPNSMPWTSRYMLNDICDSTILTFEVFAHRQWHDDQYIGTFQGSVEQFLKYPGAVLQRLTCWDEEKSLQTSLEFKIVDLQGRHTYPASPRHGHLDDVRTPFPPVVQIFDIDLHHLRRIGLVAAEDRKFYVRAFVDPHESKFTTPEKPHSLPWTENLEFNVQPSSTISFKVFAKRFAHEHKHIGTVHENVGTLLAHPGTNIYRLIPPDGHGEKHPLCASIEFKIRPLNPIKHSTSRFGGNVVREMDASQDVLSIPGAGGYGLKDPVNECIKQASDAVDSVVFPPLLHKIGNFLRVANTLAQVHPFINMAFSVLTAAYQVVHAQVFRDQCVQRLVGVMDEVYSLISSEEVLKRIGSLEKTIDSIARQTVECSYFIRHYMSAKSGWKQCVKNVWSNIDDKIQGYEAAFKQLQNAIRDQAAVHTQLYVIRLHDLILDHAAKADLRDMHYAVDASYISHNAESAPSRTDIMDSITSWVNKDDGPQIYLLLGSEESEKFNIAHAIACQFDAISRLGSSYFFSHGAQDKRNAKNLFSTVAHDLAEHDLQYMKALWGIVKHKRPLRETNNPHIQFSSFILAPAEQVACIGPVLVVIDGLEYSGSKSAHKDLLTALAEKGADLPYNFKFLVTCRPDEDVCAAFEGKSHVLQMHLENPARGGSFSRDLCPLLIKGQTRDSIQNKNVVSLPSETGETQHSKRAESVHRVASVQVLHQKQRVEQISESHSSGCHTRRTDSLKIESWTVEQHDQRGPFASVDDFTLMDKSTYKPPPPYEC